VTGRGAVLALLALALVAGPVAGQPQAPFLVGTARVSADPPPPYDGVCIGGYGAFCTRPMTEVRDPLFGRAIAVTGDGGAGDTMVLVLTNAVGLFAAYKPSQGPNGIYDIRQAIAERIPVPADHVVVQSDHSHAAPDTIGIWGGVTAEYMTLMREAAVESAVLAYERRVPATLSVAAVLGPPIESSYSTGVNAVTDDEWRVLFADAVDGSGRIATVVNYAPHATVLGSSNEGGASGDWTSWVDQEAEAMFGGAGFGTVASLGAQDWNKTGDTDEDREADARVRIRDLLAAADDAAEPVTGTTVAVDSVFIREQLAQPVLVANLLPGVPGGPIEEGEVRIDRSIEPPWLTGTIIGTFAGAARVGDVFLALVPGEAFPHIQFHLRDEGGVTGPQAHFMLGATNDFLGYMVESLESYQQALTTGAAFLAGCPENDIRDPVVPDDACSDHWTLMVSPTIGTHVLCTVQDAADRIGFTTGPRADACALLTLLDGASPPAEGAGTDAPPQPQPTSPTATPTRSPNPAPTAPPADPGLPATGGGLAAAAVLTAIAVMTRRRR